MTAGGKCTLEGESDGDGGLAKLLSRVGSMSRQAYEEGKTTEG